MIEKYIKMIAFGMESTLVRFQSKYYKYKDVVEEIPDNNEDQNELVIGSYEAAFCTDLCETYIFKMIAKEFYNISQQMRNSQMTDQIPTHGQQT
eukprot:12812504-Ditylum_brightwellii.AAC.1